MTGKEWLKEYLKRVREVKVKEPLADEYLAELLGHTVTVVASTSGNVKFTEDSFTVDAEDMIKIGFGMWMFGKYGPELTPVGGEDSEEGMSTHDRD